MHCPSQPAHMWGCHDDVPTADRAPDAVAPSPAQGCRSGTVGKDEISKGLKPNRRPVISHPPHQRLHHAGQREARSGHPAPSLRTHYQLRPVVTSIDVNKRLFIGIQCRDHVLRCHRRVVEVDWFVRYRACRTPLCLFKGGFGRQQAHSRRDPTRVSLFRGPHTSGPHEAPSTRLPQEHQVGLQQHYDGQRGRRYA